MVRSRFAPFAPKLLQKLHLLGVRTRRTQQDFVVVSRTKKCRPDSCPRLQHRPKATPGLRGLCARFHHPQSQTLPIRLAGMIFESHRDASREPRTWPTYGFWATILPSFKKYRRVPWIFACSLAAFAERRSACPTLVAKSFCFAAIRFGFIWTFPVGGELHPNCRRQPRCLPGAIDPTKVLPAPRKSAQRPLPAHYDRLASPAPRFACDTRRTSSA